MTYLLLSNGLGAVLLWETRRDFCRDGTFAGKGRLPGRDVCRDGMFFKPGLHENVSNRDDFTHGRICNFSRIISSRDGVFM